MYEDINNLWHELESSPKLRGEVLAFIDSKFAAADEYHERNSPSPKESVVMTLLKPQINLLRYRVEFEPCFRSLPANIKEKLGYGTHSGRLQIRKHFPNIISRLSSQVRIPMSQRRPMEPVFAYFLGEKVEIQNDEDFFNGLLEILEENPAIMFLLLYTYLKYNKIFRSSSIEQDFELCSNHTLANTNNKACQNVGMFLNFYANLEHNSIPDTNIFQLLVNYGFNCNHKQFEEDGGEFYGFLNAYMSTHTENGLQIYPPKSARHGKTPACQSSKAKTVSTDNSKCLGILNKSKFQKAKQKVERNLLHTKPAIEPDMKGSNPGAETICNKNIDFGSRSVKEVGHNWKTDTLLPMKQAGIVVEKIIPTSIAVDQNEYETIVSKLIGSDLTSIAYLFTEALEISGQSQVLPSQCLKLAANCKVSFETFDETTQYFNSLIEEAAASSEGNELANQILFGALLRPAMLQPALSARTTLGRLHLWHFDSAAAELAKSISKLNFSFQPTIDDFKKHGEQTATPDCEPIVERLNTWLETTISQDAPCPDSSLLLHELIREEGEVYNVIDCLKRGVSQSVIRDTKMLINSLDPVNLDNSRIENIRIRFQPNSKNRLASKSRRHVSKLLEEGRTILMHWVETALETRVENSETYGRNGVSIDMLLDSTNKVLRSLEKKCDASDTLHNAVCQWVTKSVSNTKNLLEGQVTVNLERMEPSPHFELDHIAIDSTIASKHLIHNESFGKEVNHANCQYLIKYLKKHGAPSTLSAIQIHLDNKAFQVAIRLASTIPDTDEKTNLIGKISKLRTSAIDSTLDKIRKQTEKFQRLKFGSPEKLAQVQEKIELLDTFTEVLIADNTFDVDKILNSEAVGFVNEFTEIDLTLNENERILKNWKL